MKILVAVDKHWGINKGEKVLKKISAENRHHSHLTKESVLILGRKAMDSFPGGLPRLEKGNVVITNNKGYLNPNCITCHSPSETIERARKMAKSDDDIFVAGGSQAFDTFLPYCDQAYVTKLDTSFTSDLTFTNLDENPDWRLVKKGAPIIENNITVTHCIYERVDKKSIPPIAEVAGAAGAASIAEAGAAGAGSGTKKILAGLLAVGLIGGGAAFYSSQKPPATPTVAVETVEDANKADDADANKADGADANKADGADANKADGADANKADDADANKADGADANKTDGADASKADDADANKADDADANKADGADANKADDADANKADGADANKADGADANKADGADANKAEDAITDTTDVKKIVEAANQAGLIPEGLQDKMSEEITRAQFAALAVKFTEKVTGKPIEAAPESTFTDTTDGDILKAYQTGIVKGVSETSFAPESKINREQLAAMLNRAVKYVENETGKTIFKEGGDLNNFTDADKVSSWAANDIKALASNDFMEGTSLSPDGPCTTEDSVKFIYHAYQKLAGN